MWEDHNSRTVPGKKLEILISTKKLSMMACTCHSRRNKVQACPGKKFKALSEK
jgi:hypothetical protein